MDNNFFLNEIKRFVTKKSMFAQNGWFFNSEEQEVYLRANAKRSIDGKLVTFVDIANIKTEEQNQKKGAFTKFLDFLESLKVNIYIESILNPVLIPFLIKRGFKKDEREGYNNCYYKLAE